MIERLNLRITQMVRETEDVLAIELRSSEEASLPAFTAGAHIDLHLPNGLTRSYSLMNDPVERDRYVIGVQRDPRSRGGSAWIHANLRPGGDLKVSPPLNNFRLTDTADFYLLIGGGIGITPLISMIHDLHRRGSAYRLYYCTRSPARTAFLPLIGTLCEAGRVTVIHDQGDPRNGLDVGALLATPVAGCHVYCCGPSGLMRAVRDACTGWPAGAVHFEWFAADAAAARRSESSFEIVIASTGQQISVPVGTSILEALGQAGIKIESRCAEGLCGTCLTPVLSGLPDHRDLVLSDREKTENNLIAVCCSRARTPTLVLGL